MLPGATGHLVADLLCLRGQVLIAHCSSQLSQLVPHLVTLSALIAAEPVSRSTHAQPSCRIKCSARRRPDIRAG